MIPSLASCASSSPSGFGKDMAGSQKGCGVVLLRRLLVGDEKISGRPGERREVLIVEGDACTGLRGVACRALFGLMVDQVTSGPKVRSSPVPSEQ
jgi:hypothetical protein